MAKVNITPQALSALTPVLTHPQAKAALDAATPLKHLTAKFTTKPDVLTPPKALTIASEAAPNGVPLHGLLGYLQSKAPSVSSLAVRHGKLEIGYKTPPDAKTSQAVQAALADDRSLAALQTQFAQPTDPNALRPKLLDDTLGDLEWLKLFRAFTVAQMRGPNNPTPPTTPPTTLQGPPVAVLSTTDKKA